MSSDQVFFQQCLSSVGKTIEVGVKSSNKTISGILTYATVDSLIVETPGKKEIIFWRDIAFIDLPATP